MAKKKPAIGPDGLPAPEVGPWVDDKHKILRDYLRFQSRARRKWVKDPRQTGAAYIDLFCGAGMGIVSDTTRFVDGSAIVAWKSSIEDGVPFTKMLIADKDPVLRKACAARLARAGAPVVELEGTAVEAAHQVSKHISPHGLHIAFLDPFSLGALSFELLRSLASTLRHLDILAHVSAMDLFRNYRAELSGVRGEFDDFAPGWRERIPAAATDEEGRRAAINFWKELIRGTGMSAAADLQPIRNSVNRDLYWLMLIASDDLATKFWRLVLKYDTPQTGFDGF